MESAKVACRKWLQGGNGWGWRDDWTGSRKFSVWVINLNSVSQWHFNTISCQPLLTEISVLKCVCERSGEECEPVPAPAKHDKTQLRQSESTQCGECSTVDFTENQKTVLYFVYFRNNLRSTLHKNSLVVVKRLLQVSQPYNKDTGDNSKDTGDNSSLISNTNFSIPSTPQFPRTVVSESVTVDSLFFSRLRAWPHPPHVCATTFVIKTGERFARPSIILYSRLLSFLYHLFYVPLKWI